jgi:DNA end-binding protein Ku
VPYAGSWKGFLKLSFVTCAVKLTPATTSTDQVHFHMINPDTGHRVKMKPHDAETDEVLERSDLVKGYEHEKGEYIVFEKDELDELKIESSKTIDILRFVEAEEIDRRYFDTPYYLVPDGKVAMEPFRVIQEAIEQEGLVGIANLVIANRERVVALEPKDRGLILTTLRSPEELRDYKPLFEEIDKKSLDKEMVGLAKKVIDQMAGDFDPNMFEDHYQTALRELVEAKLKGVKPKGPKPKQTAEVINLFEALKRSAKQSGSSDSERHTRARSSEADHGHKRRRRTRKAG